MFWDLIIQITSFINFIEMYKMSQEQSFKANSSSSQLKFISIPEFIAWMLVVNNPIDVSKRNNPCKCDVFWSNNNPLKSLLPNLWTILSLRCKLSYCFSIFKLKSVSVNVLYLQSIFYLAIVLSVNLLMITLLFYFFDIMIWKC